MTPDHHTLARLPDSPPHWLHSYPAHLSRTWTLASGESLRVRPVRHDDGELEEAFVRALSLESRYQRMLSGGTKVTPEWIDSMTHIDYQPPHGLRRNHGEATGSSNSSGSGAMSSTRSTPSCGHSASCSPMRGRAGRLAAGYSRRCSSTRRPREYARQWALFLPPTWRCCDLPVPWASP